MRLTSISLACALAGCSLVFDPADHMGEPGADAGLADAGAMDAMTPDGSVDAGAPVPMDEICDHVAAVFCGGVRNCCSRIPDPDTWDDTECVSNTHASCTDIFDLVGERVVLEYDAMLARRAVDEGQGYADACDLTVQEWYLDRMGLLAPIVGTIEPGGSCTPRDERDADDVTVATLACAGDNRCIRARADQWICGAPANHGESCTVAFDCVSGSRCTRSGIGRGTCEATGEPAGSACFADDECDSFICDGALLAMTCTDRTVDNVYCPASLFP